MSPDKYGWFEQLPKWDANKPQGPGTPIGKVSTEARSSTIIFKAKNLPLIQSSVSAWIPGTYLYGACFLYGATPRRAILPAPGLVSMQRGGHGNQVPGTMAMPPLEVDPRGWNGPMFTLLGEQGAHPLSSSQRLPTYLLT